MSSQIDRARFSFANLNIPAIALFFVLTLVLCCALFAQNPNDASNQRSVWDGVYTEKQAQRGSDLYGPKCSGCHGDDLEGDVVEHPALAGGDFMWKWNGSTLAPLFQRIHRDMPLNNAGSLTRDQSVDLLAYILSMNRLPASQRELPSDPAALGQIRVEAARPDHKQ
jgi:cytochrome c